MSNTSSYETGSVVMLDLTKLSPAPWFADPRDRLVIDAGRSVLTTEVELAAGGSNRPTVDMAFVALARNAFDVQLRRGWGVMPCRSVAGWWVCKDSEGTPFRDDCPRLYWPDPFTALVEADKWYRENAEKGA